ncbi:MAG TPA: metalloregulator ArsR/SmtB family transcription factor [Oleiagrimonas sp.]|nr:metalloregulator ArsR/SmtB family transcription factor [Oleiagrimonas sp.]
MDNKQALLALSALAQSTRLDTFRLLVRHEPRGLPAGEAALELGVPQNTLSTHLAILARAGLADSVRHGRSVVYRANLACLRTLTMFLLTDCCGANAQQCAPLLAGLDACSTESRDD